MNVQYKDELVVTVCAGVYSSDEGMESRIVLSCAASSRGTVSDTLRTQTPTPTHLDYMPGLPIAHQQLEEEFRCKDASGSDVMAWGVL